MGGTSAAQAGLPTPPPELKKLDYFRGAWYSEGYVKPSGTVGAGGKITQYDAREWMAGNFFLVVHSTFTALNGDGVGIALMGYDQHEKVYTYDEFYSQGEADHFKGTVQGDEWIWTMDNFEVRSKVLKARYTMKIISPTVYTYKFETSSDSGVTWVLMLEGKDTKQSSFPR